MMKAIINGLTIEGTPQEIMEYQRLREQRTMEKPSSPTVDTDWQRQAAKITSGQTVNTKGKCPNEGRPCYCTGACNGSPLSQMSNSFILLEEYAQK